ncbi:alpha-L-fucosidase [Nakamurella aerolata]|uniref:alpha-L-fucosidase n=1 Tax=Nakamurella aerolata TaxID=1656892 RepID=A0A849A5N8_9ACTN|nr:alpha-L-fucosidase [Nakamurella aerolata]NNG34956.1 family 20 glycosylhydrolase [Nakamurella aerolata]
MRFAARPTRSLSRALLAATSAVVLVAAGLSALPARSAAAPAEPAEAAATPTLELLPRPSSWQPADGSFPLKSGMPVRYLSSQAQSVAAPGVPADGDTGGVQQRVAEVAGQLAADAKDADRLTLKPQPVATADAEGAVLLKLSADPAELGREGYRIDTTGSGITVTAPTGTDLYYATRSLLQLMKGSGAPIPAGVITDQPDQRIRMVHIDAARKYWEPTALKDLIRRMAYQKMNALQLHIAEPEGFRLYDPKYPGLADPKYSYDKKTITDLVEFARLRGVDIIPGFEFPGHATAISDYFKVGIADGPNACGQQYIYGWVTPNFAIDMTSPKARQVSDEVIRTFASWFPSKYVHLGGDELPPSVGNCPRIKDYVANDPKLDTFGDLVLDYLNGLNGTVNDLGKTSIIYNGFENDPAPRVQLDKNVVVMNWTGENPINNPAFNGHQIIDTPSFAYLTPNQYHHLIPDTKKIAETWQPPVDDPRYLGSGVSAWADYNMWASDEFFENLLAPGRTVMADRTWRNTPAPGGAAAVQALADQLPPAPGLTGFPPQQRVGPAKPLSSYDFEPAESPQGWHQGAPDGIVAPLLDATGRANGSSYIINVPESVDGLTGKAWRFDNDGDGVGFGHVDLAQSWTASVWFAPSQLREGAVLYNSEARSIAVDAGGVTFTDRTDPEAVSTFSVPAKLTASRWNFLSIVADRTSTTVYVNGVESAEVRQSMPLPRGSIGRKGAPGIRGDLDNLTIYDAALPGNMIKKLYDKDSQAGKDYQPTVASLNSHPTPDWFNNDKFGIFIHWGAYSVPAWGPRGSYAEWYWNYLNNPGSPTNTYHKQTYGVDFPYDRFAQEWDPSKFDPSAWVQLFKDAGAKYFVLTSKHHEGVALFDSKVSERDTVAMGPGRDLAKELFDAARAESDLKAGFYYSLYEWFNPQYTGKPATNPYTGQPVPYTGGQTSGDYVQDYMKPQMEELIKQYDPDILWCDGQWDKPASYWDTAPVIADFYNQAKNRPEPKKVAVANRCKIQTGELDSKELDFQTPEYTVKDDIDPNKWEASRGIAHSYGYNQNEPEEDYLTTDELVDSLADIVSKNGNLLLDIGPRADGTIPELQQQRLREIGQWLNINGEAIYGTTYFNRAEEPASDVPVRYTVKDGDLYAIALDWPGRTLTLGSDLPIQRDSKVTLLGSDGTALPWKRDANGRMVITMPAAGEKATTSRNAFAFKISTSGVRSLPRVWVDPVTPAEPGGSTTATITVTNTSQTAPLAAARITLDVPAGWQASTTSIQVPALAGGQSRSFRVTLTATADAVTPATLGVKLVSGRSSAAVDVPLAVKLPNLALNKPATQKSTAWGAPAARAVDGNTNGAFGAGSVTHTAEPESQAWWQVDLGKSQPIGSVDVYNRTDCCSERLSNYWVMTSDQPFTSDSLEQTRTAAGVTAVKVTAQAGTPSTVALPKGTSGRYLRIQLESGSNPLSLAEVEVFGTSGG